MIKLLRKLACLIICVFISLYLIGTIVTSMVIMMPLHPIVGIATFFGGIVVMGEIIGRILADILIDKEGKSPE